MTEAVVAQKFPYGVDVEAGKTYFWCACGRSQNQPFCDGSHKVTSLTPKPYKAEADGKVFFCGCKATANAPLCDGSHKGLCPSAPSFLPSSAGSSRRSMNNTRRCSWVAGTSPAMTVLN